MATQQDRTPLLPLTPPSLTHQSTVILCDYGSMFLGDNRLGTVLSQRTRTSGAGRTSVRMTLDIKATPLLVNLNGMELGKGPSEAIRQILVEQTIAIGQFVKPSTEKFRQRMERAYNGQSNSYGVRRGSAVKRSDEQLARERYAAGRLEPRVPNRTSRIGNDSGRLAHGWSVRQNPKEGSWTINSPANRFSLDTWVGDAASLQAWIARFVSLVPALRDPRTILTDKRFTDARDKSPPVVALTRGNVQRLRELLGAVNSAVGGANSLVQRVERAVE